MDKAIFFVIILVHIIHCVKEYDMQRNIDKLESRIYELKIKLEDLRVRNK